MDTVQVALPDLFTVAHSPALPNNKYLAPRACLAVLPNLPKSPNHPYNQDIEGDVLKEGEEEEVAPLVLTLLTSWRLVWWRGARVVRQVNLLPKILLNAGEIGVPTAMDIFTYKQDHHDDDENDDDLALEVLVGCQGHVFHFVVEEDKDEDSDGLVLKQDHVLPSEAVVHSIYCFGGNEIHAVVIKPSNKGSQKFCLYSFAVSDASSSCKMVCSFGYVSAICGFEGGFLVAQGRSLSLVLKQEKQYDPDFRCYAVRKIYSNLHPITTCCILKNFKKTGHFRDEKNGCLQILFGDSHGQIGHFSHTAHVSDKAAINTMKTKRMMVEKSRPVCWMHWHSAPVTSILADGNGDGFWSVGGEGVLVRWSAPHLQGLSNIGDGDDASQAKSPAGKMLSGVDSKTSNKPVNFLPRLFARKQGLQAVLHPVHSTPNQDKKDKGDDNHVDPSGSSSCMAMVLYKGSKPLAAQIIYKTTADEADLLLALPLSWHPSSTFNDQSDKDVASESGCKCCLGVGQGGLLLTQSAVGPGTLQGLHLDAFCGSNDGQLLRMWSKVVQELPLVADPVLTSPDLSITHAIDVLPPVIVKNGSSKSLGGAEGWFVTVERDEAKVVGKQCMKFWFKTNQRQYVLRTLIDDPHAEPITHLAAPPPHTNLPSNNNSSSNDDGGDLMMTAVSAVMASVCRGGVVKIWRECALPEHRRPPYASLGNTSWECVHALRLPLAHQTSPEIWQLAWNNNRDNLRLFVNVGGEKVFVIDVLRGYLLESIDILLQTNGVKSCILPKTKTDDDAAAENVGLLVLPGIKQVQSVFGKNNHLVHYGLQADGSVAIFDHRANKLETQTKLKCVKLLGGDGKHVIVIDKDHLPHLIHPPLKIEQQKEPTISLECSVMAKKARHTKRPIREFKEPQPNCKLAKMRCKKHIPLLAFAKEASMEGLFASLLTTIRS